MKLGVCSTVENAGLIRQKGFDYIEMPVYSYTQVSGNSFKEQLNLLNDVGIRCLKANFFFPPDMKVVGNDVQSEKVKDYCRRAVERSEELGVQVLTIGSGKSRYCPAGFPKDEAVGQFAFWLEYVGNLLESESCVIGIEPIRYQSTNLLNTVSECIELAERINHPKVKVMTDFQQLMCQGDSFSSIATSGDYIVHTHISNSRTLACPLSGEEDHYEDFFKALASCGYGGDISVETKQYDTLDSTYLRKMIRKYF